MEKIKFLRGHASVLTTKRYLGCKQNLEEYVNDRFRPLVEQFGFELRSVSTNRQWFRIFLPESLDVYRGQY